MNLTITYPYSKTLDEVRQSVITEYLHWVKYLVAYNIGEETDWQWQVMFKLP